MSVPVLRAQVPAASMMLSFKTLVATARIGKRVKAAFGLAMVYSSLAFTTVVHKAGS